MTTITFKTSNKVVQLPDGESYNLLRESIRQEAGVPYRCGGGFCGSCRVLVEEGAENLTKIRKQEVLRLGDDLEKGYRLCCQTFATGDCAVSWVPATESYKESQKLKESWLSGSKTTQT